MYKLMVKRKESHQSFDSLWFLSRAKDVNFAESCGHHLATRYLFLYLSKEKTGKAQKIGVVQNVRTTKKTPGVMTLEVNQSTKQVNKTFCFSFSTLCLNNKWKRARQVLQPWPHQLLW